MLTAEENALLTQTGADTPMGCYFRHFWQPVALTEELPEADGPPVRVTVMGETLVAFRDSEGRVGLIDSRCPHRGADMYFGRNEECGLRCVYHGWKFDVAGKAVDLPNVPAGVRHHETIRTKAYPTREYGDMVWAWLGPLPDGKTLETLGPMDLPEIPHLEFGQVAASHRYVMKQLMRCNWAQVMEGDLDTAHFSFLHMPAPSVAANENPHAPADERRLRWIRSDPIPRFEILDHELGFVIGGSRAADGDDTYWRITQYLMPSHGTGPSTFPGETYFGFTLVPITDESCWIYTYAWNPERPIGAEERAKLKAGHGIMCKVDANYVPLANPDNDYLIDRQDQKTRTYTGVKGLAEQDAMIQQSQGPIVDRTRETLTATDAAVVRFRRRVMEAARDLEAGTAPPGSTMAWAFRSRPGSWICHKDTPLSEVMLQRFGDPLGRVAARADAAE